MQALLVNRTAWWKRPWSLLPRRHAQNWEIYASLLFLFFYFAGMRDGAPAHWLVTGFGALVFLVLYFAAYWLAPGGAAAAILCIGALGAALLDGHPGASAFLCYAASLACYLFRPRYGIFGAAVALAAFLLVAGRAGYPDTYLAINALVIVAVAAIHIQARRSTVITERLRLREAELAQIHRASERRRIAHDLHDELGQHLVAIALKAELGRKQAAAGIPGSDKEMAEIASAARYTLTAVRRVVDGYSARPLLDEVRNAEDVLRLASVEAIIQVEKLESLSERQECFLALILREAVTSVARHAHAARCFIRLRGDARESVLEITDDGRGARGYDGFGVEGMRERAAALGGGFDIRRDCGTHIRVCIPLSNS